MLTTAKDYGCQGLFQNYINNHPDGRDGPAGLGLGHAGATGLNVFFQFFCYVTPILGAIVADQYLGKYNTILVFAVIYWVVSDCQILFPRSLTGQSKGDRLLPGLPNSVPGFLSPRAALDHQVLTYLAGSRDPLDNLPARSD